MDDDPKRLRDELETLSRLKFELEEQDTLIMELARRAPGTAVGEPQISILETVFNDVNKLRSGLVIPFTRSDDPDSLRPQIRSARARVDQELRKHHLDLESSERPKHSRIPAADTRRVFVVHGRNAAARDAIFNFLPRINLDPIEWEEAIAMTGSTAPSNLTTIERAFSNAHAAVIILSGDDLARLGKRYLSSHDEQWERQLTRQARPNVIFEAGMAFGFYPTRTVIVSFGKTRPISDIAGINILYLADDAQSRKKIAGRLTTAGCDVDIANKTDWLTAGDFEAALHEPDQIDGEKHAGLKIIQRRSSPEDGATYKPKVWIDIRNDSGDCLHVQHLGWTQTSLGIQIKAGFQSLQLKIGKYWCPKEEGVESIHLPPGGMIRLWVQPDETHDMKDLQQRCHSDGRIGRLNLQVDEKDIYMDI